MPESTCKHSQVDQPIWGPGALIPVCPGRKQGYELLYCKVRFQDPKTTGCHRFEMNISITQAAKFEVCISIC